MFLAVSRGKNKETSRRDGDWNGIDEFCEIL